MEIIGRKFVSMLIVVNIAIMIGGSLAIDLCNMNEDGLEACKPSVTKQDPVDPPSAGCCKALSGADLTCLCSYRNSVLLPSLGIDPDLALGLPVKCGLSPPADC